jgi:hypothetical protein
MRSLFAKCALPLLVAGLVSAGCNGSPTAVPSLEDSASYQQSSVGKSGDATTVGVNRSSGYAVSSGRAPVRR